MDANLQKHLEATIKRQAAELEALRADAERYRWLRDKAPAEFWERICWADQESDIDAAIDAARMAGPNV